MRMGETTIQHLRSHNYNSWEILPLGTSYILSLYEHHWAESHKNHILTKLRKSRTQLWIRCLSLSNERELILMALKYGNSITRHTFPDVMRIRDYGEESYIVANYSLWSDSKISQWSRWRDNTCWNRVNIYVLELRVIITYTLAYKIKKPTERTVQSVEWTTDTTFSKTCLNNKYEQFERDRPNMPPI